MNCTKSEEGDCGGETEEIVKDQPREKTKQGHGTNVQIIKLNPVEIRPPGGEGGVGRETFLPGTTQGRHKSTRSELHHVVESTTAQRFSRNTEGSGSSVNPWSVRGDRDSVSGGVSKPPVIQLVQLDTSNFLTTIGPLSSHRLEEWLDNGTDIRQINPAEGANEGPRRVVYSSFMLPAAAVAAQTITEGNSVVEEPPKEARLQEAFGGRGASTRNLKDASSPSSFVSKMPLEGSFTVGPFQNSMRDFLSQRTTGGKGHPPPAQSENFHKDVLEATQDIIEKAQLEERRKALFSTVRSTPTIPQTHRGISAHVSRNRTHLEDQGSAQDVLKSKETGGIDDSDSLNASAQLDAVSSGQNKFLSQDHIRGKIPGSNLAPSATPGTQPFKSGLTREYMMDREKMHQKSGFRDIFRTSPSQDPFPRVLTPPRLFPPSPTLSQRPSLDVNFWDRLPPIRSTLQPYNFNPFQDFLKEHGVGDEIQAEIHNTTHFLNSHTGFDAISHSDKEPGSSSEFFIVDSDSLPLPNDQLSAFNLSQFGEFKEERKSTPDFSFGQKENKNQHQFRLARPSNPTQITLHHPQHNSPDSSDEEVINTENNTNWSSENKEPLIVPPNSDQHKRFRASYKKEAEDTSQSPPDFSTFGELVNTDNQWLEPVSSPPIDKEEQDSESHESPAEKHPLQSDSFSVQGVTEDSIQRKDVLKLSFDDFRDREFQGIQGGLNLPSSIVPVPPPYYPPTKPPSEITPPPHIAPATPPPDRVPPMPSISLPFDERLPELFENGASEAKDTYSNDRLRGQEGERKDDSFIHNNDFHGLIDFELQKHSNAYQPDNFRTISSSLQAPGLPPNSARTNHNSNRPFQSQPRETPGAVAIVFPANMHPPDSSFLEFQREVAGFSPALHHEGSPSPKLTPEPLHRLPESDNLFSTLPNLASTSQSYTNDNGDNTKTYSEEDEKANEVEYREKAPENSGSQFNVGTINRPFKIGKERQNNGPQFRQGNRIPNFNQNSRKPPFPKENNSQFFPQGNPHFAPGNTRLQFNQDNRQPHNNPLKKQPLRQPQGNLFFQGPNNLRQLPPLRPPPLHAVYVKPPPDRLTAPPSHLKPTKFINFDVPSSENLVDSNDDEILSFSESISNQHTDHNIFDGGPADEIGFKSNGNPSKQTSQFQQNHNLPSSVNLPKARHPIHPPATSSVNSFSHPFGILFPSQSPQLRNPSHQSRPLGPSPIPPLPPSPPPAPSPRPHPHRLQFHPPSQAAPLSSLHPPLRPPRFPSFHEMESDFQPLGVISQPLPEDPQARNIRISESHAKLIQNMQYGVDGRPLDIWIPILDDDGGYNTRRSIQEVVEEKSIGSSQGTRDPRNDAGFEARSNSPQEGNLENGSIAEELGFGAKEELGDVDNNTQEAKSSEIPHTLMPRIVVPSWA
ncbi:uncharacterized protein [Palaemon carinicauda]|uniref:uncharacterized protein n=1 Tax=Palaemon carinicauda TaxID=392227 RepID=UPI0035B5BF1D